MPRLAAAPAWYVALCAAAHASAAQSVHAPASAAAQTVHELGMALYWGAGAITLLVLACTFAAFFGPARPVNPRLFVLGGGILFPAAVLSVLLGAALLIGNALSQPLPAPVARIQVIAHRWWWEVRYLPPRNSSTELARVLQQLHATRGRAATASSRTPGADRPAGIVTANEIRIPVGHAVEIELHAADVIHSLWVPALGGKVDAIPGRVNRLAWQATRPGTYRGQCAEFCGGPHGSMALVVVVEDEQAYRAWLQQQAASLE